MNRKSFLQTLLGIPAVIGLAKATHAESEPPPFAGFKLKPIPKSTLEVRAIPREVQRLVIYGPRRSGKTTAAAMFAADAFSEGKRIFYGAPNLKQAKRFGEELTKAYHPPLDRNGYVHVAQVTDVVSGRGFNADLVILDQFNEMDYNVWAEVFAPMLIDNNGEALLIYQGEVLPGTFPPSHWGIIHMDQRTIRTINELREPIEGKPLTREIVRVDSQGVHWKCNRNPYLNEYRRRAGDFSRRRTDIKS